MTRRLPGKKFKTEYFNVDSAMVPVDIRVETNGRFFADVDGEHLESASLEDLKKLVHPVLLKTRRLEWDPYIYVEFEERHSRFDNHQGEENRQEITLEFKAGWMSRIKVEGHHNEPKHRWVDADVDPKTCEIVEATYEEKRHADTVWSHEHRISFTPDRWRRLAAIAAALADVRGKLAYILADGTAARLDAVPSNAPALLAAMPAPPADAPPPRKRR